MSTNFRKVLETASSMHFHTLVDGSTELNPFKKKIGWYYRGFIQFYSTLNLVLNVTNQPQCLLSDSEIYEYVTNTCCFWLFFHVLLKPRSIYLTPTVSFLDSKWYVYENCWNCSRRFRAKMKHTLHTRHTIYFWI